jgi:hypothetical protein
MAVFDCESSQEKDPEKKIEQKGDQNRRRSFPPVNGHLHREFDANRPARSTTRFSRVILCGTSWVYLRWTYVPHHLIEQATLKQQQQLLLLY